MHFLIDARRVSLPGALDEQGAATFGQPAGNRPASYFVFGYKMHSPRGENRENVQPGNMVGDQERAVSEFGRYTDDQSDTCNFQDFGRPARDKPVASGGLAKAEQYASHEQAPGKMNCQPAQPE